MPGLSKMERIVILNDTTSPCEYIKDNEFISENFIFPFAGPKDLEILLARGFRHFGPYFFRPICHRCGQCIPLRIPVKYFIASRSVRRVLNKNKSLKTLLEKSKPKPEAFNLYQKHKLKFGESSDLSYWDFCHSFFYPADFSFHLSMFSDNRLIGVSHLDITGSVMSAVYTYYDTDLGALSLGTYAIAKALEICVEIGLDFFYPGYFIQECSRMNYKARFRPNQALIGEGEWIDFVSLFGKIIDEKAVKNGFFPQERFHPSWIAEG